MGIVQLEQILQRNDVPSDVKEIVMDHLDESKEDRKILRKSEAKLRAILEAIPDLVFQVSKDGTYLSYKGAKEDLYSAPEEFLGKKIAEVMPKEITEPTMHCIERTLQTGELQIMTLQMPIAGKNRDFDLRMVPCGEDEVLTLVREITTKKTLQESEEKYRVFFEEAPISLWEHDFSRIKRFFDQVRQSGVTNFHEYFENHPEAARNCAALMKIIEINKATLKLFGAKNKEEIFLNFNKLFSEASLESVKDSMSALAEGKTYYTGDASAQSLKGEILHLKLALTIFPGYEESLSRILLSVVDITEQKLIERELRESEERLRAFMDAATDNLFLIDSDLNIMDINKTALNILNLKKVNVVGRNITEFLPDAKKSGRVDGYLEVIKTGEPLLEENIVYHPPFLSHPKYRSVRSFKVGEGLGIISTDITERIKAEKNKEDLEKKRSAFVSMMSHELRTPITVIKGYTEFLDKNIENIDSVRKTQAIQSISQNVLRLERLIKGVADITRMEQGIFKLETTVINFSKFLKESTRPYKEFYGKKFSTHGTLEFVSPVFLNIDIDLMKQVLDNLIDNANKHTPDDGRIIFKPTILSNTVQIAISDTGVGIDSSVLERIFEQFVSITTEQASGGTGIGLYVSRIICEAHEGTLTAHSEGKNQGATFLIELPRWLEANLV